MTKLTDLNPEDFSILFDPKNKLAAEGLINKEAVLPKQNKDGITRTKLPAGKGS